MILAGLVWLQEVNGGEPLSVLSDSVRAAIMKNITRRMTPQPLKIRADVDMTCFAYDGVLHIQVTLFRASPAGDSSIVWAIHHIGRHQHEPSLQEKLRLQAIVRVANLQVHHCTQVWLDFQDAMRAAGKSGTDDCPVQMKLVAPPLYVLTTQTLDKNKGIQVLNDAIEVAEQTIKSHKGNFKVKEAPRTVSERDDLLLQSKVCTPGAHWCKWHAHPCSVLVMQLCLVVTTWANTCQRHVLQPPIWQQETVHASLRTLSEKLPKIVESIAAWFPFQVLCCAT